MAGYTTVNQTENNVQAYACSMKRSLVMLLKDSAWQGLTFSSISIQPMLSLSSRGTANGKWYLKGAQRSPKAPDDGKSTRYGSAVVCDFG